MRPATYRALLRTPGALSFFLTATLGRVGIAMTGLGLVWLVHARTGSYGVAGLVTGGFAVAEALGGPQVARLVDRHGQPRVLPPVLLAHAAAVAALITVDAASPWLMTAAGALAGITIPQLGALSAARWAALLRDTAPGALPAAFSLESLANSLSYLAGPAVVSLVAASGRPAAGTALAAGLIVVSGLGLAVQRRTAPPPATPAEHARASRALLGRAFSVLAVLNIAIGVYFGAQQVSVTAFVVEHGAPAAAAPIFAVSGCGGLLAGWLYGLRPKRTDPRVQLVAATGALALASLLLLTAGSPTVLGALVVMTGGAVPPILVLLTVRTEAVIPGPALTQAFSWLNSASAAGTAAAASIAGRAVDASGASGGFAVAAAATVTMAVLAAAGLSRRSTP